MGVEWQGPCASPVLVQMHHKGWGGQGMEMEQGMEDGMGWGEMEDKWACGWTGSGRGWSQNLPLGLDPRP